MSFSFQFHARSAEDAIALLEQDSSAKSAPSEIRDYVRKALTGLEGAVHVEAYGHLFDGRSHPMSNATIKVTPIAFREPAPVA